jgi:hypothetical protein
VRCTLLTDPGGSQPTEEIHRMSDTTVSQIHSPTEDALTAVLKRGAEDLLAKAASGKNCGGC